ncbi:MAG: GIY-YIG nuclease family protein [Betaproteobacteria bacterium]|nr:GIY-YIG nuclease family protein [Betaproteobacteria bacterium]
MPYVYILTNKPFGTLYTGFANDLSVRVQQHKSAIVDGFTKEHGLKTLVWYEQYGSVLEARNRERLIKKWHRDWKINLIQSVNPDWKDLSASL